MIIQKITQVVLGILFLFSIGAPTVSANEVQKKHSQTKTGRSLKVFARSTSYHKNERRSDADTRCQRTSTQINIGTLESRGLGAVAVDPAIIPYGSKVIAPSGKVFVAVDTGSAVVSRKASRKLALVKKLGTGSPEYKAPVLDFYSQVQIGDYWDTFTVLPYQGPKPFAKLTLSEKIQYLSPPRISVRG